MSALARILMQKGRHVQGSDLAASPLLEQLGKEGALVHFGHDKKRVQKGAIVIYSSDIKENNEELSRAKELKLPLLHRSELLKELMEGKEALLVTGTHGKTTTSSLLSWVLFDAGLDPTFALGGVVSSLNTNGRAGKGNLFVAEADESDGSFLQSSPFGAIVTNLNHDHMNYWKTNQNLKAAFQQFFSSVKSPNHLFWCKDCPRLGALTTQGFSYGFSKEADLTISAFRQNRQGIHFNVEFQGKTYPNIELSLFGKHNALNGAAVFGLCLQLNIEEIAIRKAFQSFLGTKRRLEYKGEVHKVKIYDDYGHHPVEIAATLKALREIAKERRLIVLFQPHRYTRVKDLFDDFLTCFSDADLVVLTDIYSAGEAPLPGVTSASLYTRMKEVLGPKLSFFPRTVLEAGVVEMLKPLDVVLTIGAGDITHASVPIFQMWVEKRPKIRVALLSGGASAEHEVSLLSAAAIIKGLNPDVYDVVECKITKEGDWLFKETAGSGEKMNAAVLEALYGCEVCIPVFHGPQGEDGMIQGFLDTLRIPYVGCGYGSSAVCMHKGWTKQIALMHGIPTAPFFEMDLQEYRKDPELLLEKIKETALSFPIWIKPVHLGSSIGVNCVRDEAELKTCVERAFSYDDCIIVESHIEGRQIEFGMIGNEWIRIGPACEILNEGAFVSYKGKYGSTAMPYAIPARLSQIEADLGADLAKKMYRAVQCKGLARIDFFIDHNGHFWFNEINPFPGCTDTSAFPKIWVAADMDMEHICDELIACAFHRSRSVVTDPQALIHADRES